MCVCKGRKKEGKEQLNRFIIESIYDIESIQCPLNRFNTRSVVFLINTWAACRNILINTIQQFFTPRPLPSPLKLPRVHPTRLSTNLSIQDHPAAIGVKISSTVLEECTFTSKEIRFEAVAVQGFLFVKSSRPDPTDHKVILLIHVSLGFVLIVCNSNEK